MLEFYAKKDAVPTYWIGTASSLILYYKYYYITKTAYFYTILAYV